MMGERLSALRRDADLTQDDLAIILNINKHSISSYERNKSEPPEDIKIAIAKYFQVSVDYLLGVSDHPAPIACTAPVLRLPSAFPPDMMPELKSYVDFLMYKSTQG